MLSFTAFFTPLQREVSRPPVTVATVEHRKAERTRETVPNEAHSNPMEGSK
jgi:hypothetical protein